MSDAVPITVSPMVVTGYVTVKNYLQPWDRSDEEKLYSALNVEVGS